MITTIFLILKFWDVIRDVILLISKLSDEERNRFHSRVVLASVLADETGDTSAYEQIFHGKQ